MAGKIVPLFPLLSAAYSKSAHGYEIIVGGHLL